MTGQPSHFIFSRGLKERLALAVALQIASLASAAELDFYRDVYPFLKANCISCHNKTTTKSGLNLETPESMKKGGETGPGLVPGKGAKSLIVQAAMHTKDLEMPPKNNKSGAVNLTAAEIKILKTWIDQGAKNSVQQERPVAWQSLAPGVHPIYTVAMTPDGRYAACGRANQIFLYDLATRQFVTQISSDAQKSVPAHRALVQSLAFSPDGTRLASGSFREVKIWRREKGESIISKADPTRSVIANDELSVVKAFKGVTNAITAAIAGATRDQIVTASDDGKVRVWSRSEAKVMREIVATGILCLGLSQDGKQLVTGGMDGAVRVLDFESVKPVAELRGSVATTRQIAAIDWTIAAQGVEQAFQKSEVSRIEAQNKALDELLKKANETITTAKKLLPEKQKALIPAQEALTAAKKSADEAAALAAKSPEGKPDAEATKQLRSAQEKLASATMAETSAQAAVSAAENSISDAEADVKRITETKEKNARDLAAANTAITSAKEKLDKATAELTTVKRSQADAKNKPLAVALSIDGQQAAALFSDGTLNVWAVASGMPIEQVAGSATASGSVVAMADGSFYARRADGSTLATSGPSHWVLERVLGSEKDRSLFADRVNAVRFSPDGKTLAAGGGEPSRSGDICLFDVATGKLIQTWKERHQDTVLSLDFSPDGKLLASGAADKIAKVTEIATGKQVNLFEGHTHHVMGVAFRADGRVLATAGGDGVVLVWDMIMGERKKKIEGWGKEVTSLQFIGATRQIVTSAGDNLVRIVNDDGTEVRSIAKLPDFMQSAASSASTGVIIGGGEDSLLHVWDGTNGKELASFGAK